MGALHTIIRFKELTGSRIEVLQFKIIWSFQGHAKSFCMPLPPPQDIFREASGTSTHISKVEQLCIILLYQRHLQKETEEILLTRNSSRQSNHIHHKLHCSGVLQVPVFPANILRILLFFPPSTFSEKALLFES